VWITQSLTGSYAQYCLCPAAAVRLLPFTVTYEQVRPPLCGDSSGVMVARSMPRDRWNRLPTSSCSQGAAISVPYRTAYRALFQVSLAGWRLHYEK
jgi:NADPH:quinone reductase-like Zn-dependent oxidoreductase